MMRSWLRGFFASPAKAPIRSKVRGRRLVVESLEERTVPTAIVVNNPNDTVIAGKTSLREALGQALTSDAADDTITFDASAFGNFTTQKTTVLNGNPLFPNSNTSLNGKLTILGPGPDKLAINGNGASSAILIGQGNVSLSGLTITGATTGLLFQSSNHGLSVAVDNCTFSGNTGGGGIHVAGSSNTLTMTNSRVINNTSTSYGSLAGGITCDFAASATLTKVTISGNTAPVGGGMKVGIGGSDTASVSMTDCTVSNNAASAFGGGAYVMAGAHLTISDSTFSGNTADSGGAIYDETGYVTVIRSTLNANSASGYGGGIYSTYIVDLSDCTISGNSAVKDGGGVFSAGVLSGARSTLSANTAARGAGLYVRQSTAILNNSIIAGNTGPDATFNDQNLGSGAFGAPFVGGNPMLAPLGNYGGSRQTMPPLPGSPVIDAGNPGTDVLPATDQRGQPRLVGGLDLGAVESQGFTLTASAGNNQTAPAFTYYAKPVAFKVVGKFVSDPVDGGTITFATPSTGASASLSSTSATIANGIASSPTLRANGIPGSFSVTAQTTNATSSVTLTNLNGGAVVTNLGDPVAGKITLLEALAWATSVSGNQTITFDPAVIGSTMRTLSVGDLNLARTNGATGSITIQGPGANLLTLDSDVFASSQAVTLSGVTLRNLNFSNTTATVTNCTLTDTQDKMQAAKSTVTLTNCTFADRFAGLNAYGGGAVTLNNCTTGAQFGGLAANGVNVTMTNCTVGAAPGVRSLNAVNDTVVLTNCTFSGLTSPDGSPQAGGGVYFYSVRATLNNCTVTGGVADAGGALYAQWFTILSATNCTFSNNKAFSYGGGLVIADAIAALTNCTVAGNSADDASATGLSGGGISMSGSDVTLANCTIAGNRGTHVGGIDVRNSGLHLINTIVAGNTNVDGRAEVADLSWSPEDDVHEPFPLDASSSNNLIGVDPLLGPLANNGGPTQTMAPLAGSPAINAGQNSLVPAGIVTDQRGKSRIVGSAVDIGAVESGNFTALTSPAITYGTTTVKLTGHLDFAGQIPVGLTVAITLNSVTQNAAIDSKGNFSTTFSTATLPVGSGSYQINYVFAGNASFPAVTDATTKLTVNKRALTITAGNGSKVYGTTFALSGLTYTQSGLVNNDSITGVTYSSTGAAATANEGSYTTVPVAVGTGLANYTIKYLTGKLTVDKATLTITASADSKTYGVTKAVTSTLYTATGLVTANGDSITSVTSNSPGFAQKAAVGSYTITPTTAAGNRLTNYNIVYVTGTLTVNKAALTITAKNDSKTYGAAKTFTTAGFTQTGLVSGDTITAVTLTSTGAAAGADTGTYSIAASAAAGTNLANYTITYVSGTLTVNKAALTITASSTNKTYGTTKSLGTTAFTTKGLVNGDTITGVTLASTGTVATAAAGSYTLTASAAVGAKASNYTITYVAGKLTVDKATLTITASAASKTYGVLKSATSTDFTATGLVNGDTITSVTSSSPGYAVSAQVGTYAITPTAAAGTGLANYTIVYAATPATLTVTKATLTITAKNDVKVVNTTKTFSTLAFTSTGLITANGDTITGVTLSSPGAASSAKVGQYAILVSNALGNRLSNYAITYVSGTLTVAATK